MFIQNGNLYVCKCDQLYEVEFADRRILLSGEVTLSIEPIDHWFGKQYYLYMVREHSGAIYSDHIGIDQNMSLEQIVDIFHSGMLKYLQKLILLFPDDQKSLTSIQQFYEIGSRKYIESEKKVEKLCN